MIDIHDRSGVFHRLVPLQPDAEPVFGLMRAQHMVEHLAFSVQLSNGRLNVPLYVSPERAQVNKEFILGDGKYPIGFKSPLLSKGLEPLRMPDLASAIDQLKTELAAFDAYFTAHPNATLMNPLLGNLSFSEWTRFHNRHFTHHYSQFNLSVD